MKFVRTDMTAEFENIGMALDAVNFARTGRTVDSSALVRPPSPSSLGSQTWPSSSSTPAGPSSMRVQAHRHGCVASKLEHTGMAVEFECAGVAGMSIEFECTGMATDVARTGLADESLDFERTNLAGVKRAPVRRGSPPPGELDATRSTPRQYTR